MGVYFIKSLFRHLWNAILFIIVWTKWRCVHIYCFLGRQFKAVLHNRLLNIKWVPHELLLCHTIYPADIQFRAKFGAIFQQEFLPLLQLSVLGHQYPELELHALGSKNIPKAKFKLCNVGGLGSHGISLHNWSNYQEMFCPVPFKLWNPSAVKCPLVER